MPNTFHYIVIHVERVCAGKNWGKNIRKLQRLGPFIVGGRREDAAQNLCQLRSSGARDWKQPAQRVMPRLREGQVSPLRAGERPGPGRRLPHASLCQPGLSSLLRSPQFSVARPAYPRDFGWHGVQDFFCLLGSVSSNPGEGSWSSRPVATTTPAPSRLGSKVKAVGQPCWGEGKTVWWQLVHVAALRDQGSCPQASFFLLLWQPRDTLIFLWGFRMWLTEASRIPETPPDLSASHFPYL